MQAKFKKSVFCVVTFLEVLDANVSEKPAMSFFRVTANFTYIHTH